MKRGGKLFVLSTFMSIFAFGLDILILWLLVQFGGVNRTIAASIGFIVGISLHYVLSRKYVFTETSREVGRGYVYFLVNGTVGLVVTIGLFTLLDWWLDWYYLITRTIASVVAGAVVFGLNAVFNFKEIGSHE